MPLNSLPEKSFQRSKLPLVRTALCFGLQTVPYGDGAKTPPSWGADPLEEALLDSDGYP